MYIHFTIFLILSTSCQGQKVSMYPLGVCRGHQHQKKSTDNQISGSKLPCREKWGVSNHHINYSAKRYEERERVGYAKVDGEVEKQAQYRVSTDETPRDVLQPLNMEKVEKQ